MVSSKVMFLNIESFFGVAETFQEVKQFINSFRSLWKYTEKLIENESMEIWHLSRILLSKV